MSTGKLPPTPPTSANRPRTAARKRNPWPVAIYWSTFILCAGASFAAGFWFTYSYTSQVGTRGLTTAVAPQPGTLVTPIPQQWAPTPEPIATPQDLFAADPTPTPMPLPTEKAKTPPPTPVAVFRTPEPVVEEPTPEPSAYVEPTPEDVYRVQVGSYETRESAEQMVQELLSAGIQAVVVYDSTKYHAQVGAFSSKERALAVADEVNAKGYSVTIRH